jgi:hypothetical protein
MSDQYNNNNLTQASNSGVPTANLAGGSGLPAKPGLPPKQNFFQRLSKREQWMSIILIILVVGAVLIYFAIMPASKNLNKVHGEIKTLRATEVQMRDDIAQLPIYKTQFDEAKLRYDTALVKYNSPMDPELLDETITSLMTDSGFDPSSLTMSSIGNEAISPYNAAKLEANEVPVMEPPADTSGGAETTAPATEADTDALLDGSSPEVTPPSNQTESSTDGLSGPSAFAYSITATGEGTYKDLLNILTQVKTVKGLYLTTYSYDATASEVISGAKNKPAGTQSFSLTFKLYVFVKGN